jgi:large subunit ribosomal protein L14e
VYPGVVVFAGPTQFAGRYGRRIRLACGARLTNLGLPLSPRSSTTSGMLFTLLFGQRTQKTDSSCSAVVEGPSSDKSLAVPRHSARLAEVQLTSIVISKLPRGIGSGALKGKWESAEVEKKWEESAFAKSRAKSAKRRQLNDFERFKVMRLRKQVRFEERKQLAKIKASA